MGGLAASIDLAAAGHHVVLLDKEGQAGGKVATTEWEGSAFDSGPTVLTLKKVFDDLFLTAGTRLVDWVTLHRQTILARHAFADGTWLDLVDDRGANVRAIREALGGPASKAYEKFAAYAATLYERAAAPFIFAPKPTVLGALGRHGLRALAAPWSMDARRSMRTALHAHFRVSPHLEQLFARYATYSGASPDRAPATFNLISHVEAMGVWTPQGGMAALARGLVTMATKHLGVTYLPETEAEKIEIKKGRVTAVVLKDGRRLAVDAVLFNGDARALEAGLLGAASKIPPARESAAVGLSAVTLVGRAHLTGRSLAHHNVLFAPFAPGQDEFSEIFERGRMPSDPSLYLCAQDRAEHPQATDREAPAVSAKAGERLFFLFNAPASPHLSSSGVLQQCQRHIQNRLGPLGLKMHLSQELVMRGPQDFAQRFPASQGALYGRPPHSWRALFDRHGSQTPHQGLFLAGGTTHPGPGLPMAAQSGRLAAQACLKHLASMPRSVRVAMPGGISTPRATTTPTP